MSWGAEINRQVANATERELASASATIAELQKRIGELEEIIKIMDRNWQYEHNTRVDAEQAYDAEHRRLEEAERVARPLAQAWESFGNVEAGKLSLLRSTLGLWHFREAHDYFHSPSSNNKDPD